MHMLRVLEPEEQEKGMTIYCFSSVGSWCDLEGA